MGESSSAPPRSEARRSWSTSLSYLTLSRTREARAMKSAKPDAAFVLLLVQSMVWLITGLSAAPFALAGEVHMAALALATMLLALGTMLCAIGVLWRRGWARAVVIALEVVCLFGTAVLFIAPIGFNHGLVSILVNAVLPLALIVLLPKGREAFS